MINSRLLGIVTDDWQLSGLYSATSGSPFSITATNNSVAGAGPTSVDLAGNLFLPGGRSRDDMINEYFNTAAVAQPQPGSWGNLGRKVLLNPASSGTDVSMTRSVPLKFKESANLQFRAEFFSLFNHRQLGGPDSRIGRSTFGTISTVGATPYYDMAQALVL